MESHLNTSLGHLGALKGYHPSSEGGKFLRCVSINQMRRFTSRPLISLTMDTYFVIMKMVTEEVFTCSFFIYIWECICNLCCNFVEGIIGIYFSQNKEHSNYNLENNQHLKNFKGLWFSIVKSDFLIPFHWFLIWFWWHCIFRLGKVLSLALICCSRLLWLSLSIFKIMDFQNLRPWNFQNFNVYSYLVAQFTEVCK